MTDQVFGPGSNNYGRGPTPEQRAALMMEAVKKAMAEQGAVLLERCFPPRPTKQVIVMRADLNMRKGKIAAQAAHASMKALLKRIVRSMKMVNADGSEYHPFINEYEAGYSGIPVGTPRCPHLSDEVKTIDTAAMDGDFDEAEMLWYFGKFRKICVQVASEQELVDIYTKAEAAPLRHGRGLWPDRVPRRVDEDVLRDRAALR